MRLQTLDSAGNGELLSQPSDRELSKRARSITPNNAEFLGFILTNGKLLGERIAQMKWQLLIAPNNASFITSDQPVLYAAAEAATCEGSDFFALAQAAIMVPVSQNVALRCVPSNEPAQNMVNVKRDFVRKINRMFAENAHKIIVGRDQALIANLKRFFRDQPEFDTGNGVNARGVVLASGSGEQVINELVAQMPSY